MPELPEVETIVRSLRHSGRGERSVLGMTIEHAEVYWARTIQTPSSVEFIARIKGQSVGEINRRGKYLLIKLSTDYLIIHLRMSGDLHVEPIADENGKPMPPRKHDRAAIFFEQGYRLSFEDTRKFGRMWLVRNPNEVIGDLGPEPLDPSLTEEMFFQLLHANRRQLKPLLLDQTFLAGLGNIYTDEALHLAHLHPLKASDSVSAPEAAHLLAAIRSVLLMGIETNGASIDWVYRGGSFQNKLQVYGRENEPCFTCGHPVEKIIVGQRGTHFCPVCQPFGQKPEKPTVLPASSN